MRVIAGRHGIHGRIAVREGAQLVGHCVGNAQAIEHFHKVNARCGQLGVGKINACSGQQGGLQLRCCFNFWPRRAALHGHACFDRPQMTRTARQHMPRGGELLDERRCQNDHITGRTIHQLLLHGAHCTKCADELRVSRGFNRSF